VTSPTPPIPTFTDGLVVHANQLNALGSNLTNLYNYTLAGFNTSGPLCIAYQNTGQAMATGAATAVSFNATVLNRGNMWVASQPTQLTIQTAGTYILWSQTQWDVNSTGYRQTYLTLNGTSFSNVLATNPVASVGGMTTSAFTVYPLTVGATIFSLGFQNCGSSLNTTTGALLNSSIAAVWIAP
jgi:hypothetical protein